VTRIFSAPRTPQQNGVIERKNKTLEDIVRTLICGNDLQKLFWAEIVILKIMFLTSALTYPFSKIHNMNCLKARNQMYVTSRPLEVSVSSTTMVRKILVNLMQGMMKIIMVLLVHLHLMNFS